jgi:hypothetical protein
MASYEGQETRVLVRDTLELRQGDLPQAERVATDGLTWAIDLLHEDERRLIAADREDEIAFGRWLTLPWGRTDVYELVVKNIPQLVRGLVGLRLAGEFRPYGQFNTVGSMATAAGMARAEPFLGWAPRAQLLVSLIAAYLTVKAGQPRVAALTYYSNLESAGRDSTAYGVQRLSEPTRSVLRLGGVAGLGGDFVLPRTSQPDMSGMPADPSLPHADSDYRRRCEEELASVGLALPRDITEHIDQHMMINDAARDVLHRALSGSRACYVARVPPEQMLSRAFPPWLAIGPLERGVSTGPLLAAGSHAMPGGDPNLILRVTERNIRPIFRLFDSIDYDAHASLQDLHFSYAEVHYSGRQLAELLISPERLERLPGLSEASPEELDDIAIRPSLKEFGVAIDPEQVAYLWHHKGVVLADGNGKQGRLSLVLRSEAGRHTAWTTIADLSEPVLRDEVIARCELHFLGDGDVTHAPCVPRTFKEFGLHCLQPRSHATRTWMQIACLLANHCLVEVARGRQAS